MNHKHALAAILLLSAYLRVVNLDQPIWPDEALYAKTAENLISRGVLTFDGNPWTHQFPLFVLFLAVPLSLLGSELSMRMVSPFFGAFGVLSVYALGRALYGTRVGLLSAFFLALFSRHWFFSRMMVPDIALATLLTLSMLFLYRSEASTRNAFLAGLFIGLSAMTKRAGLAIYIIAFAYLILKHRGLTWTKNKNLLLAFAVSLSIGPPPGTSGIISSSVTL